MPLAPDSRLIYLFLLNRIFRLVAEWMHITEINWLTHTVRHLLEVEELARYRAETLWGKMVRNKRTADCKQRLEKGNSVGCS
jgi:hypothetical protein